MTKTEAREGEAYILLLTNPKVNAINNYRRALPLQRLALVWISFICSRNRHLPEWRFPHFFTIIVTVYCQICKVIRIVLTSFRRIEPTAVSHHDNAPRLSESDNPGVFYNIWQVLSRKTAHSVIPRDHTVIAGSTRNPVDNAAQYTFYS
jgi:hypothetical protein